MVQRDPHQCAIDRIFTGLLVDRNRTYIFCRREQIQTKHFPYNLTQLYDNYCKPLTYPLKVLRKEQDREENKDNKKKNQLLWYSTHQTRSMHIQLIKLNAFQQNILVTYLALALQTTCALFCSRCYDGRS